MNCFFTMKKKLAGTQIQGGLFPITVFKKKKQNKKSVAWTKEYHKLQQSWTYSLCSNSVPQSAGSLPWSFSPVLCKQKAWSFSWSFSKPFSPCLSLSGTHSCPQARTVAHYLASPPSLPPLSNKEISFVLQFSSPRLQLTFLIVAVHSTARTDSA